MYLFSNYIDRFLLIYLIAQYSPPDLSADVSSRDERETVTFQRHHLASVQDIKNLERKVSNKYILDQCFALAF